MKFFCARDALQNALSIALRSVAIRSTVEIYTYILIKSEGGVLKMYAYNADTGMIVRVDHAEVVEEGAILVPAKFFSEIVRKLPDESVEVSSTDRGIRIEAGKSVFTIGERNPDEFQAFDLIGEDETRCRFDLTGKVLSEMITGTIFSSSSDAGRKMFLGLCMQYEDGQLDMVGADGFRVAVRHHRFEEDPGLDPFMILVPAKTLGELEPVLNEKESVRITVSNSRVLFETEQVQMVSPLIDSRFFDYKNIIPKSAQSEFVVDRARLIGALERASLVFPLLRDTNIRARFLIDGDCENLNISAAASVGTLSDEMPIELSGEPYDADFNPSFVIDACKAIHDDKVRVRCNGETGPMIVVPVEEENDGYLYLLLPIRR